MAEPTAIVPDGAIRPGLNETGSTIARRLFVKKVAGGFEDSVDFAGVGDHVLGATMDTVLDGDRGNVQTLGQAIVTSGAAVSRGAELAPDAAGKAVTAAPGYDFVAGIARSEATGADQDIEVELVGPNSGRAA